MENLKIYTAIDDTGMYNDDFRYGGTYLHGQIETDNHYDIFAFSKKTDFEEGIHYFKVNDRWVVFFLYKPERFTMNEWRGYLVYANDYEELVFCAEQFNKRKQDI
jgi:hypothetical protein